MVWTICIFLGNCSHCIVLNPQLPCIVRKFSETVMVNLNIIRNTFINIRINSFTLHFHHSDWFQIVRDCRIFLYHKQSDKYSAKWDRGFSILSVLGAVSQKILRLRYTLGTSSPSWKNITRATVWQQTIVTATHSHSHS